MSPAPSDSASTAIPRTTESATHDSYRLVRLRLTLALIATAILPIVVATPIIRFATDDSRAVHVARQERLASDVARAMDRLVGEARATLVALAEEPALVALAEEPTRTEQDVVRSLLRAVVAPGRPVSAIAVLDPTGAERHAEGGRTVTWPEEVTGGVVVVPEAPDGAWWLVLTVPIPSTDGGPHGDLVAGLPMERLLASALAATTPDRHAARIVDTSTGRSFAASREVMDPVALQDRVIGIAADLGGLSTTTATVPVPGIVGIAVEVADPFPVTSLAPPIALSLVALVLLIIGFIVWMARHILRPAAELEASRTRLRLAYDEVREIAVRDSLTGLGNHRAFQEEFEAILDQSRRYGHPMALVLIDIDEFKMVNDTAGHGVGDDLLAEVGRLLRQVSRTADRAFRIGGDEFALLLPHTDGEGALQFGRRLLASGLEVRPHGRYVQPISFSAGVSSYPAYGTSREDLHQQADAALYRSKRTGRTAVTLIDPTIDVVQLDDHRRAALSSAVARVIADHALRPVFQPIVHLPTGRPIGFEGLIRPGRETGFPDPGTLFSAAAVAGRTVELDLACLDTIVGAASSVPHPLLVSLNVSPRTLEAAEFSSSRLLALLDRVGLAPDRVILEVTENDTIDDASRVTSVLARCREAGIRVAADDVGAGNAGLRLLSQLRFDVVKIDLSLVHAGAGRETVREVLGSVVGLARRWGALVVAEGVETTDQLRLIRELGVDAAQGYLLGRPTDEIVTERLDLDAILTAAESPYGRLGLDVLASTGLRATTPAG